ncbi:hypothetical protein ZWY2020_058276 [Hordeum vulgare]|nr:hypothetical protein ZWY2020_010579 [Hordeum vulgare]KAI5021546.1 hypothetical protein ZWY2020_058276 [Hordeum vulgare]
MKLRRRPEIPLAGRPFDLRSRIRGSHDRICSLPCPGDLRAPLRRDSCLVRHARRTKRAPERCMLLGCRALCQAEVITSARSASWPIALLCVEPITDRAKAPR